MTELIKENTHKNLVVYTALFGNYDDLIELPEKYEGYDFICFTDQDLISETWVIVNVTDKPYSNSLMNRFYKFNPHIMLDKYDKSIYIDSNIRLKGNPLMVFDYEGLALANHTRRNCIYKELLACFAMNKIDYKTMIRHYRFLSKNGFPESYGLTENNIIFREHNNKEIKRWGENIWNGLLKTPERDQLWAQFYFWKLKLSISDLKENAWHKDSIFEFIPHNEHRNKGVFAKSLGKTKYLLRLFFLKTIITPFILR